jgi:hypothetical protein
VATEPARTITERRPPLQVVREGGAPSGRPTATRARKDSGPDRLSVILFSLAAVLVVLTLLTKQLLAQASAPVPRRQVIVRKVYRTTIVTTIPGAGAGTSVSQSVTSSPGSYSAGPMPTTRSSSAP